MRSTRPWLICGLIAPALALATDVLACARWRAYDPVRQSISELSAVDAPTRPFAAVLGLARDATLSLFAAGVGRAGGDDRALRAMGRLILANAALDAAVTAFLPRDYSQPTWSRRNTANTLVMATGVACSIGAMGTGAIAPLVAFRAVSVAIPATYVGLTVLALALTAHGTTPNAATGAQERTMAYSYQLWLVALAAALARETGRRRA